MGFTVFAGFPDSSDGIFSIFLVRLEKVVTNNQNFNN